MGKWSSSGSDGKAVLSEKDLCLAQSQPFPSADDSEKIPDIDMTFNKTATSSQTYKTGVKWNTSEFWNQKKKAT